MALVTVHRSPSPINDRQNNRIHGSLNAEGDGNNTLKSSTKNQSESYLAVKGAALILTQTECSKSRSCETGKGDIQVHLQLMLYLLRVQDKLKLAVKLESRNSTSPTTSTTNPPPSSSPTGSSSATPSPTPRPHSRYMALVSSRVEDAPSTGTNGTPVGSSGEVDVILGIDILDSVATVGLVLPVRGDCDLCLDGDGGFNVSTNGRLHNFKPVSVQAMWAALQCLIKVRDSAIHNSSHLPSSTVDGWSNFYSSMIKSESSFVCEWHATLESTIRGEGLLSLGASAQRPEDARLEKTIRSKLKQVMMTVDLEEVTSKYLREKLEEDLGISLSTWKRFIDDEMIIIMRQMDAPSEILPYLYLGSEWNASNLEELQSNKVGYILNVTREIANFYPDTFEYHNVRIFDEEDSDLLKHWENTHKFISRARDTNSKVLVHCKMGVSRSASTVIAFVMKEINITLQEAIKYVKSKRSCIQPNRGFREQLETYEGILDASKQRHSRLWQSSSSIDLQENPTTTPISKPIQINIKSSPESISSPSTSPSSSTISCDHLRSCESEVSQTIVVFTNNNAEVSDGQALKIKDRKRTYHVSTSSDDTNVFEATANNNPYVRPNRFIPSPSDNKSNGIISKSKSFLSIWETFQNSLKDQPDRKPCFLYSRSRSVSPKSHVAKSLRRHDDFGITSERRHKSPSTFKRSSEDPSSSKGRLSKKNESFSSRVRPDNFWIRDEPMNINEMDQDVVDEGKSSNKAEAFHGGPALTDLTSGKVKRTKHEIENRQKILTALKADSSTKQDKNAILPHFQRSSSFKMERSKCKGHDVEKRKTFPLSNNIMNNDHTTSDVVPSGKGSSTSSSCHMISCDPYDGDNLRKHSKSTVDIQSAVGSRHSSVSDGTEVFKAKREGAKVWTPSNKIKVTMKQLQPGTINKPLPVVNNSKISPNSSCQLFDRNSSFKGEGQKDIRWSLRCKKSLNFHGSLDHESKKVNSTSSDNSLGTLNAPINGSNAMILGDAVGFDSPANSKSVSSFYLEIENESLQDDNVCGNSRQFDSQEDASLKKHQSKAPHNNLLENRLPAFASECNVTPKVFQVVCNKNVKKVESPVIFLPSAKPVFSMVSSTDEGKVTKRPQELGIIRLNASRSSGNLIKTELEGISKPNSSRKFVSPFVEESSSNFSVCSAMTSKKRSTCHFPISSSILAPTKSAAPDICTTPVVSKENPHGNDLAFASTMTSNHSSSCSKPSTPTYHVEQSLLCQ